MKLIHLNQNGDSLKSKQFVVNGFNRKESMIGNFNSITPLSDGGFLITATTDTVNAIYPNGSYMGMVVKVDSALKIKWHYVHRTPDVDEYAFTKAKELTDGTILVLGFKFRPSQGGNGFQIYRFSPGGQLKNVYPFTSSICSQVWGITFDALADTTYLIGGRCGNNPPITYGFYVAKVKIPGLPPVVPPFTITATKEETLLTGTNLGQSYPNPTAGEAIIPYTLPKSYGKASIQIREIATGRELRKYELKPGSNSLTVNVSSLSSGLYLYSLVVDEKPVATKKLAVMK
ncbi:T9SS type A sorting domain-containing protein [Adhaeribacter sp. BT258]|uniref:T9SS type A sorting domain-containing protein n=1 Tax=Adhaeribacter terrigena TaxID=2793070 RepID=A0ABS1C2K7_9BACT|nr:T9SS type A sorting domain-containing protein [Adhaeribacter terrigena]MBK0403402.1 T9SS type A sorting domain-containing protein [Adhaeribacter terrigena]